jgi:hypothetical protein
VKNKKKYYPKNSREANAFPYLTLSIEDRLRLSNSINLTDNFQVVNKDSYWSVVPKSKGDAGKKNG